MMGVSVSHNTVHVAGRQHNGDPVGVDVPKRQFIPNALAVIADEDGESVFAALVTLYSAADAPTRARFKRELKHL